MKRLIVGFLVFLLCVNFPLVVSGQEISSLENQYTENVNYRIAPEDLFPFIYSEGEEFAWFRDNVIGSNSCIEGYLYVKNLTDGSITKILDDPVTMFRETLDSLFCITFDQKVVQTDYVGSTPVILYEPQYGSLTYIDYLDDHLYLVDGDRIISLYIQTLKADVIAEQECVTSVYPVDSENVLIYNSLGEVFRYDAASNRGCVKLSQQEADALLMGQPIIQQPLTKALQESNSPRAVQLVVDFPHPDYPVGSHFSEGGICDHKNGIEKCKYYASSRQCDGFAMFAHEEYIHVPGSTWSVPYRPQGDTYGYPYSQAPLHLGSATSARVFFSRLTKGAFVRYAESAADWEGFHSIVFISSNTSGITVYECNQDWACGVDLRSYDFSVFNIKYDYIAIYVSHTFDGGYSQFSSAYHKSYCSTSDCSGYIYEVHTAYVPGNNATCAQCGYVGKITTPCPVAP